MRDPSCSLRLALRRRAAGLRRRLASEAGFAVPTVMLMTVAGMGIASVGVMASIQGQSGVVRDQGSKTALAVAESGAEQALLHYNRDTPPCTPLVEGEWCGPVAGLAVNGGAVSYWARTSDGDECDVVDVGECVEIVSVGTLGGVTRRVNVFASSLESDGSSEGGPFVTAGVLSLEDMILDSNSMIHTGVATNGNIELKSNAKQCGHASVGVGKELGKGSNAGYYTDTKCTTAASEYAQQELTLPAISEEQVPTENDNGRFFALDTVSGNKGDACWNGFTADGGSSKKCDERELFVDNNSTLTLTGSVYSFCKLTLRSNASLYVPTGSEVTIYFDSPENCEYESAVTQLDLSSNSRITGANAEKALDVAMLFVGSDSIETNIELNSNTSVNGPCEQNFVIYAPRSHVELDSNSKFCGAIAGKSVHLDSNAEIWNADGSDSFNLPGEVIPETAAHYEPYRFIECSAVVASPPDTGC